MMRATLSLGLVLVLAGVAHGQSNVTVELDEVVDNRMSTTDTGEFQMRGGLELRVKLAGNGLDNAAAARVIVKEAKDDKGNSLVAAKPEIPDFMPREYNSGTLQVRVDQPARAAATVRLKGTVELYVPSRDPAASVKIEKALSKLDAPLSSKALKTAKLEITPLSRDGYAAAAKARKITDKDIELLREEGKKRGADPKEIELAIEMARAFEGLDEAPPENAVIFSGRKADFDRIYRVDILGADGNPVDVGSRGTSTRGESVLMTLNPSSPLPADAALQLMLLTDKARVSFPFDLKVELP
jgi:hypothetical protein